MKLNIGDTVKFLTESGQGKIVAFIDETRCKVQDDHGFNAVYLISNLVPIHSSNYEVQINDTLPQKDVIKQKKPAKQTEIDLHIEELVESSRNMSNTEILLKQMFVFKNFYKNAKLNKLRMIVAIHGVGEGVLRNEIRTFLDGQDDTEYFDADYTVYGYGATAIRIYYNY